jgi:hypothetical protein
MYDWLVTLFFIIFFNKIYLQYVNTLTAVLDNTKIVPGQPISFRTLAVQGGHGTTSSRYGRYSSEKMAQKEKTLQQKGKSPFPVRLSPNNPPVPAAI